MSNEELLSLEMQKPDYHDTCFRCNSEKLPENPWYVFKDDGISTAPVCEACANDQTPGEIGNPKIEDENG